jgi:hypothetical protein
LGKTVAFPFVRDDVKVPTGAAKKLSAFFVNAPVTVVRATSP